jgi:protein-arginine kinase activator protein McsA
MIQENLFDLTEEQVSMSKIIYNGKTIKCLVAPYHSHRQLENLITYTPTTYLFPEKEMTAEQVRGFISMVVSNPKIKENDEIRIITASQSVILDMIDGCVRILTEYDTIVDCPIKTFMANIHDIRYEVLENEIHQKTQEQKNEAHTLVNKIITDINNCVDNNIEMDEETYNDYKTKIKLIGEPLISNTLLRQLREVNIKTKEVDKKEMQYTLSQLTKKLQKAIDSEDFELAKQINDEIKLINL